MVLVDSYCNKTLPKSRRQTADRKFAKFCPTYHITRFSGHIDTILYESILHLFNFHASITSVIVCYFNAIGILSVSYRRFSLSWILWNFMRIDLSGPVFPSSSYQIQNWTIVTPNLFEKIVYHICNVVRLVSFI